MFFMILVMKELYLGSKILDFFIKFEDLLGSNFKAEHNGFPQRHIECTIVAL